MTYTFHPLTATNVREMATWDYPAPYDLYSIGPTVTAEEVAFFTDPANGYFGVWERDTFIGFCCFGPDGQVPGGDYSASALDVGAGFRPDLTGRGDGAARLSAILDFGRQNFTASQFRATIAVFNQRAQNAVRAVGFRPISTFTATTNGEQYVVLVCPA